MRKQVGRSCSGGKFLNCLCADDRRAFDLRYFVRDHATLIVNRNALGAISAEAQRAE